MPELPEVETMRRGIEPIVGHKIRQVHKPRSRLQPIQMTPRLSTFRRRVHGRSIVALERLGKRVVVVLDSEDRIVFEPRMSGLVLLADPPDEEHLRLVFELSGRPRRQLLFWNQRGLGVVRLLSPRQFQQVYAPEAIGPDALDVTAAEMQLRLGRSRRAIKVALMDQRALAGIGNLYASEILHHVGIDPQRTCVELKPAAWRKLHAGIVEVLGKAIDHQGSTLRDGTYRIARNEPGNFQLCHRVYQRAGEPCLRCDQATIERIVQAQRSTFYCPACQR